MAVPFSQMGLEHKPLDNLNYKDKGGSRWCVALCYDIAEGDIRGISTLLVNALITECVREAAYEEESCKNQRKRQRRDGGRSGDRSGDRGSRRRDVDGSSSGSGSGGGGGGGGGMGAAGTISDNKIIIIFIAPNNSRLRSQLFHCGYLAIQIL